MHIKKLYKFYYKPKHSKNYLVAACVGKNTINLWKKFAFPLWKKYCVRNNIGLLVFHDYIIPKTDKNWKPSNWQKQLFGLFIKNNFKNIKNICLIDVDILVNPYAPNIFDYHQEDKISIVSQITNLPYTTKLNYIKRKIAYYRHNFYCKKFPLDSSLTMDEKKIFEIHGFKKKNEYFCMGVFVFNINKFSKFMKNIYFFSKPNQWSLTGGDEPFMNYHVLSNCKINWLDYKFQTIWSYEVVEKYPFLYEFKKRKNAIVRKCVETSLQNCFFLHFAGSWYDSKHMEIKSIFSNKKLIRVYTGLLKYYKINLKNKIHKYRIVPGGVSVLKKI